jgi:hypothetical protein
MTTSASRIHGHTGAEEVVAGRGEVVAVGAGVTELAALVREAGDVVVEVGVAVDVDVDVEVFVGALVVEVLVEALVEVVDVRVGASLVGALVRDAIGVREGSVGRLTERDPLGRFEPPPHDAVRTSAIARSVIDEGRILLVRLVHALELRG